MAILDRPPACATWRASFRGPADANTRPRQGSEQVRARCPAGALSRSCTGYDRFGRPGDGAAIAMEQPLEQREANVRPHCASSARTNFVLDRVPPGRAPQDHGDRVRDDHPTALPVHIAERVVVFALAAELDPVEGILQCDRELRVGGRERRGGLGRQAAVAEQQSERIRVERNIRRLVTHRTTA